MSPPEHSPKHPPEPSSAESLQTPAARICGFSFGRNLTRLGYPVEAAVRSVLPVCDEFVFVVGQSDDDTRARVAGIAPGKVRIIDSAWPEVKIDGTVLAIEANKAMSAATATGCTWGFYIQADEVVHEDDLPAIRAACDHWAEHAEVKALLFKYLHFALDYQTIDPWMYHKAARLVRLDDSCHIVGDACGPAIRNYTGKLNDGYLDKHHLGAAVRWAGDPSGCLNHGQAARIFHYGWVKTRAQLDAKLHMVENLWWGTLNPQQRQQMKHDKFGRFIQRYPLLKKYHGSHPAVMAERLAAHPPFARCVNRWLNPRFYAEVLRHGFHG